jgi:hypothetical protein
MRKCLLGVVAALLILSSCSEDIDLTAPYKDITVAYGLLDAEQGPGAANDTVWIRIQKAFLGDDNALLYSVIPDSLFYPTTLDAWIKAYNTSGVQTDSFHLTRTVNEFAKDPGIFTTDSTVLYRGVRNLNTGWSYKLFIKKPNGDTTSSQTVLCNNVTLAYPPTAGTPLDWEPVIIGPPNNKTITFRWVHDANTYAYQFALTFNYQEWLVSAPGNITDTSFTYYFPLFKYGNAYSCFGNQVCFDIDKPTFYQLVSDNITEDVNKQRKFISIDISVFQASEEFYNYITINAPSLSYVQKVTAYTNITNGLGIFGSRTAGKLNGLILDTQTKDSLMAGYYTHQLNFVP